MPGKSSENRGRGRPTKWDNRFIGQAYDYCLEHHGTNQDIANHLGIPLGSLYDYKAKYPKLSEAIQEAQKKWRQAGCGTAVRSLFQMIEMQIVEVPKVRQKKRRMKNPETGEYEMVVVERTEIVEKHVFMPSLKAIWLVLSNMDPDNWKRNPEPTGDEGPSPAELIRQALREFGDMHKEAASGA